MVFSRSKECIPHLLKSDHAHILNLAPPLNLNPIWFANHVAYTMAKYGMSMCVLGMSAEFRGEIGVNALWPKTAIHTAAVEMLLGDNSRLHSRKPDIMADAAYSVLCSDPKQTTGNFFIDEDIITRAGIADLKQYACHPENADSLMPDAFLDLPSALDQTIFGSKQAKSGGGSVESLFQKIESSLSEKLVQEVNAVYHFEVKGDEAGTWFINLKEGSGACGRGDGGVKPDTTLTMDSKHFFDMFSGKLKASSAFMSGKLRITGDLQRAMKLEKLMGKLKSKL